MPCGCGKKRGGPGIANFREPSEATGLPEDWGPSLWFILHLLAHRIGSIPELLNDYRLGMDMLINWLPFILPCEYCQEHCRTYLSENSISYWANITDINELKLHIQIWLMNFHNTVRSRKNQEIIINTIDDLNAEYTGKILEDCQIKVITDNILFGVKTGKVKMVNWKRWQIQFNKMKVMLGL